MALAGNLGYPRIGPERELKRETEAYWNGGLGASELLSAASQLRRRAWSVQQELGIDLIPCNDFSLYDHVLDAVALVGAVPARYGWGGGAVDLDIYFAMARGAQREGLDVGAMEMTKWFDTNYHYIVPEFAAGQSFSLSSSKAFDELAEAHSAGVKAKPVLLGPVSLILLGKSREPGLNPLAELLEPLTEVYGQVIARLAGAGAEWIQLDEPFLVRDTRRDELAALERAYGVLAAKKGSARLILQSYFGHVGEAYPALCDLPVDALGLDLVRGPQNLQLIQRHGLPGDKWLVAGVVDGRNIWISNLDSALTQLESLAGLVGSADRLIVAPSCSLLHVPIDVNRETELDPELRSWLAFTDQKLAEVVTLTRGLNDGRTAIAGELAGNARALKSRRASRRTCNPEVRGRLAGLDERAGQRQSVFERRRAAQRASLVLPALLPTTSIGSYPQTAEVRQMRGRHRKGELSQREYEGFIETEIRKVIELQEDIGLDVLVHGEFERTDMVEYFAQQLDGYAFTRHGWVQSYGSRYVRPPILYGDIERPQAMTVRWFRYAQSLTDKPVKGMLTGPVTMLQWSFVRDDQPRSETCRQLALAVRDEVLDLEAARAKVIQVDEPALREGLPLRRADWQDYLDWAVGAFRLATGGVADATQIHTHMCYSEFNDIIEAIAAMDADVLLIENARSGAELLEVFKEFNYRNEIGPGVYDIHSPRIPSVGEMEEQLRASLRVLENSQVWVTPDCGLKTRSYDECVPALRNMVEAARRVRSALAT
ncbi:MAG: 5-methyltetrahydropteroyltriglutamate--homocysteine methyltransferase [Gemmatimonas sp. SM23_52]|nr:MAG: 5-methyltetrahydropteroyltriglutamate--homocysteine methyltransferase [Gemmatimonas sp. SM23_52]